MKTLLISCLMMGAVCTNTMAKERPYQQEQAQTKGREIHVQTLEALIGSKTPMALLDARRDEYFDGTLIFGAKRLPSDATEKEIEETIPDKNQLVIVYCAGEGCEASKKLAKRLIELGYLNTLDYHEGIRLWKKLGNPVTKIKE